VVDTETGLVATTRRQSLGNVTGEREVSVTTDVTVEREGGYRMETIVYADGERQTTGRTEVRNVDALTPAYAESSVSFHRFENTDVPLRAISYRIESVADNRTTLNVSVYFTNRGDEPAGDLTLRLRARQADSNVVADETRLSVGQIRPGRTETIDAELTVPDGYNYWLDGILQSDGVIVATESAPANLDPQETLELNETRRNVGFQSGDFAEEPERERATEAPEREATIGGSGPGFTAVAALAALLAGTIALARRRL
jgi:PGF-CTERM protein